MIDYLENVETALNDLLDINKRNDLLISNEKERIFFVDRIDDYQSKIKKDELIHYFSGIEMMDNKIKVYRAICVINHETLNNNNVGESWSFNIKKAYCFNCKTDFEMVPYYFLLYGLVDINNVNWNYTIQKAIHSFSYEKELMLIPNSDVEIYEIDKLRKTTQEFYENYKVNYLSKI